MSIRRDKIYDTVSSFSAHTKTKAHQKWLAILTANKSNYYADALRLEECVKQQRIIIAKLEREIHVKSKTIDILTERLMPTVDLMNFD